MDRTEPLGRKPAARDPGRGTAEPQRRAAIPHRHTAPGIPVTKPAGRPLQGHGAARPSAGRRGRAA